MGFVILSILGFNLYLWYRCNRYYSQWLNHVNIFSIVWFFVIGGAYLLPFIEVRLKDITFLTVLLSWTSFLLFSFPVNHQKPVERYVKVYDLEKVKIILGILLLFSFFAYLISLGPIIRHINDLSAWAEMRRNNVYTEVLQNNLFYTLFARNHVLFVPISFYLLKEKAIRKLFVWIILIYGLVTSALYFTRAPILEYIVICLVSYLYIYDVRLTRKLSFELVVLTILFFTIFIFSQSLFKGSINNSIEDLKIYLFSGINDLQLIIDGNYQLSQSQKSSFYSLDFINYILQRLSIIKSYPSLIRDYSPFIESNVYTYLDAFIIDFGILGGLAGSAVIGIICKEAYIGLTVRKTLLRIIVYSLLCYYSAMIFMNNEFIRFSFILFVAKAILVEYFISNSEIKTVYCYN